MSARRLSNLFLVAAILATSLVVVAPGADACVDVDCVTLNDRGSWTPPVGSLLLVASKTIDVLQKEIDEAKAKPISYLSCKVPSLCNVVAAGGGTVYRIKTVCLSSNPPEFHMYGCWDIYAEGPDSDKSADYFMWKFAVSAQPKSGHSLFRVKGRSYSDNYSVVKWSPDTNDQQVGNPTTISGSIGASAYGVSGSVGFSYSLYPGTKHAYVGPHIFHNSWISNANNGSGCCPGIQTDGVNEWKTAPSQNGLQGTARVEIWFK
ncbi:MAG: hypothetical protein ACREV8_00055 [Gammaproteobacteria bacterium]